MNIEFSLRKCANLNKNGCSGCLYEGKKKNCFSALANDALKEIRDLKDKLNERQTHTVNVDNNYFALTDRNLRFIEAVAHDLRMQSNRRGIAEISMSGDEASLLAEVLRKVYKVATPVRSRTVTFSRFSGMPEITAMSEDHVPESSRVEREEVRIVAPVNRGFSDEDIRRIIEQGIVQVDPVSDEAIARNRAARVPASLNAAWRNSSIPTDCSGAVQSVGQAPRCDEVRSVESQAPRVEPVLRPYREVYTGVVDTLGQSSDPLCMPEEEMERIARAAWEGNWGSSASDAPSEISAASTENQT